MLLGDKKDRSMNTQSYLTRGLAGIVFAMLAASPLGAAADPALEDFRAEIDAVIGGLSPGTSAVLEWAGADPFEIRREGDTLIATITGANLIIHADDVVHLTLDRRALYGDTADRAGRKKLEGT